MLIEQHENQWLPLILFYIYIYLIGSTIAIINSQKNLCKLGILVYSLLYKTVLMNFMYDNILFIFIPV